MGPAILIESAMDIIFGDAGLIGAGFALASAEVGIAFEPLEWELMKGGAPVDDFILDGEALHAGGYIGLKFAEVFAGDDGVW